MDLSSEILSEVGDVLSMSAEPEKKIAVTCVIEHALLPEHLANYADEHGKLQSAQKADEKDVQALRSKHHAVARLLAENVPEGIVAQMTGYTASHISVLKNTPAMIELISFYRGPKNEAAKMIGEKLRMVADMSLEVAMQRIEKDADKVTISELTALAKLGFDRSGNGPQSTVHNIEEHRLVPSEELIELSREARRRDAARIVDVRAVREIIPTEEKHNEQGERRLPGPAGDRDNDGTGA